MYAVEQSVLASVFRLFIMVAAVFGNGLILFVVGRNRKLQQRGANLLFAQLAVADLLIGVGVGVRATATIVFERLRIVVFHKGDCLSIGILTVFGIHLSQATMMSIAFDRFLCIQFPLFYRNSETLRFSLCRFLLCAAFSLLGSVFAYVGLEWDEEISICAFGSSIPHWYIHYWNMFSTLFTFFIYALYITIFMVYKTRIQTIHSSTQRSLFRTITAVLVSYFFLWGVPNFTIVIGNVVGTSPTIFGYLSLLVAIGSGLNASTNIFIYGWKHSELGSNLRNTLTKGFRRVLFCRWKRVEPKHSMTLFSTEKVTTERKVSSSTQAYGFEYVDQSKVGGR
ncbi:hypothetical protein L596_007685 [Steinernema carpocapsae]|uniref:G-protein coupled receptors family 1 profile domain-containing protein n=1 Tax=Steinernema carpocapsae TaxID=34508 RepID=A0A4U5PB44_STECR|nr:hypothetical protein L596_007685 [Steinernema carpocapsae]